MQKKLLISIFMLALISVACVKQVKPNQLAMHKISGLKMPESVVQAKDGKIYVSEINGFGQDGDGQITVIENGHASILVKGLDDPKGLTIIGQSLYVADNKRVLKVDLTGAKQAQVQVFAAATAFPEMPLFLNDLEPDLAGNLYVSDSGDLKGAGGAIYKINPQGKVTLVINSKQDARILAPNGLLMDDSGDVLMEVDFVSGILYSYNMKTKVLNDVAEGFGGGDGLVHHSNGSMFISDWKNGKVFKINLAGEVKEIKSGYQSAADIALTKDEKTLMMPDMKAGELDFISLQ